MNSSPLMDAHFFSVEQSKIENNSFKLSKSESSHFIKSLRGKKNDIIWLLNGKGIAYKARVEDLDSDFVCGKIISQTKNFGENKFKINLAISLLKGKRMEMIVEKATEFGVVNLFPLAMNRSIRKKINHSRFQNIIISSAKQCGRSFFPVLHKVSTFNKWIEMYKDEENVVCHMSSDYSIKETIKLNIKNLNIIIGPEGDFSQEELILMDSYNFKKINLGNRRLRAESAAMSAMLKICQILE
ncbi:MAG: 16S rRNA (uracil(1498)-N(3))-methyltransferase [bacterium TMED144]|nr:MAG: 16S rRNA (uracil(1498)-N(3))-methyltransferase [bacterium TMED144]